jgi:diguanylate cyclase (GGDEF)-like protein
MAADSPFILQSHLKTMAYANRLVLLSTLLLSFAPNVLAGDFSISWQVVAMGLIHLTVLMMNEVLVKTLKRVKTIDLEAFIPLCVFIPLGLTLYFSSIYLLSGSPWIYILGWVAIFEAHCLGCIRLGHLLALGYVTILLAGLVFGHPLMHAGVTSPIAFISAIVLMASCLMVFGHLVAKWVHQYTHEVDKLTSIASTDVLTGLTNRREFNARLNGEIARARRYNTPLSLALFDLDDFKRLNDVYGHQIGDRILKEMGLMIRQNIRESDIAARYGGEEFALILPETKEGHAAELLERLREMVSQTVFCMPDHPLTVSVSIGIAQLNPRNHTSFEFVELADMGLYEAKRQGKNRVIRGSTLMSKVLLEKPSASEDTATAHSA